MNLDQKTKGHAKYGLINFRKEIPGLENWQRDLIDDLKEAQQQGREFSMIYVPVCAIELGDTPATENFVIKLKDEFSAHALQEYARAAESWDHEYADEIWELAGRAGPAHPLCKKPD